MNDSSPHRGSPLAAPLPGPRRLARGPRACPTGIAWLFITPTMLLLLAINIFPLIWTI
jgi:multiple sugar transport system permease protein